MYIGIYTRMYLVRKNDGEKSVKKGKRKKKRKKEKKKNMAEQKAKKGGGKETRNKGVTTEYGRSSLAPLCQVN